MLKIIISLLLLNSVQCFNLCDDWVQYKDLKCLKVLDKIGTKEEAVGNCTQLNQSSTLLTIHSKEEQEFLINSLNKYNQTSEFAWIGIKYTDNAYKWTDSSQLNYENWAKDAVKDGTDPCVQLYLTGIDSGKWTDVSCKKTALIVCQKNPMINSNTLKTAFDNLTDTIENKFKQFETQIQNKLIPIGFIYTQLMNQKDPNELWPQFKCSEVTEEYSGLFFRAEVGESLPFGQIQSQNQSWISDVHFGGEWFDSWNPNGDWSGLHWDEYYTSLSQANWNDVNGRGDNIGLKNLAFYTTAGEVRPKNTAIKIFKRIE